MKAVFLNIIFEMYATAEYSVFHNKTTGGTLNAFFKLSHQISQQVSRRHITFSEDTHYRTFKNMQNTCNSSLSWIKAAKVLCLKYRIRGTKWVELKKNPKNRNFFPVKFEIKSSTSQYQIFEWFGIILIGFPVMPPLLKRVVAQELRQK